MAREQLLLNGLNVMAGDYIDVERFVRFVPEPAGENPFVSGRSGTVWRPKRHGPGGFAVTGWVGHPTDTRAQVQARWDTLLRHIAAPMVQTQVVWVLSDGTQRTCQAELVGRVEPVEIGQRGWRAQCEFTIPAVYWFGASGSASGTGASGTVTLTWQAPSSAPLEHLTYTLTGPFTQMTVTSPSTGESFTYANTVGTGQSVVVNSGTWDVTGAGGHTVDRRLLSYTSTRFLTVLAGLAAPTVQWSTTGGGGGSGLSVAGTTAFV